VRASLKDPLRTTAKTREAVYFRASTWEDGKPVKQGALPAPAACTLSLSVCSEWGPSLSTLCVATLHRRLRSEKAAVQLPTRGRGSAAQLLWITRYRKQKRQ